MNKNVTLLDCTFRDGGYYTNWFFEPSLVKDYLVAIKESGIKYIEIGFRSVPNNSSGPFAFCTDDFLSTVLSGIDNLPEIGVMVNASDILRGDDPESTIHKLFPLSPSDEGCYVSFVRIACHLEEVQRILPSCRWLISNGYKVGINLMQIADKSDEEINTFLSWIDLDLFALYIGDSFGGLSPDKTKKIIYKLVTSTDVPIGIHAHNNMGLALINSIAATEAGASLIDVTVAGMGRGPGNTQTENALLHWSDTGRYSKDGIVSVLELIKSFQPLMDKFKWGQNPYYFLSGKNSIHPSYVQEMLSDDNNYTPEQILCVLDYLKLSSSKKFNYAELDELKSFYKTATGSSSSLLLRGLFDGKDILLVGNDPKVKANIKEAKEQNKHIVVLNSNTNICEEDILARIAVHPIRILADLKYHSHSSSVLITPRSMLPAHLSNCILSRPGPVIDYGVSIGEPNYFDDHCSIPDLCTLAYSIMSLAAGGAKSITLVGFFGYEENSRLLRRDLNLILVLREYFGEQYIILQ